MRRLLALFSLVAYVSILAVPFAMAKQTGEEAISAWCKPAQTYSETLTLDKENYQTWYEDAYGTPSGECGVADSQTGMLEKGDCTEPGEVITEISEVIGSDVTTGDSRIITVYTGTCCLLGKGTDSEIEKCDDKRTIYYETYEGCSEHAVACSKRQWIIATSGAGIIKVYVKQIYRWAAGTVGFVAVVTIVISGIQISVSGVSGDITSAKDRIIKAISAIVLLFLSGLLLYTINPTFFS